MKLDRFSSKSWLTLGQNCLHYERDKSLDDRNQLNRLDSTKTVFDKSSKVFFFFNKTYRIKFVFIRSDCWRRCTYFFDFSIMHIPARVMFEVYLLLPVNSFCRIFNGDIFWKNTVTLWNWTICFWDRGFVKGGGDRRGNVGRKMVISRYETYC